MLPKTIEPSLSHNLLTPLFEWAYLNIKYIAERKRCTILSSGSYRHYSNAVGWLALVSAAAQVVSARISCHWVVKWGWEGGGHGGAIGEGKVKLRVQLIEQVRLTDSLCARNEPQIICFLGFTANSPRRASSLENWDFPYVCPCPDIQHLSRLAHAMFLVSLSRTPLPQTSRFDLLCMC